MSFTFNWPRFSDQFHYDAIQMLNTALNKGNKPPIIADKIEVVELEMGTQPPELEIRDIGDLTTDQFRGIFRLTYNGDAHLVLKTKVQANPLNHKLPDIHQLSGSTGMLAAQQPLVVPMLLRLSHFRLSSYVVLVVSKQKGITIVFKTDPLQNVDINSTFDSIAVIQIFIQREIEGQLRQMFREDLPSIIHRLSQQWVKAKVETPYQKQNQSSLKKPPIPPLLPLNSRRPSGQGVETMSMPDASMHLYRRSRTAVSDVLPTYRPLLTSRRPRSTTGISLSNKASPLSAPPLTNTPSNLSTRTLTTSTHEPEDEPFDPSYGLRPEGLPTKPVFKGFSNLFTHNKGLADLAEESQTGSIDDGESDYQDSSDSLTEEEEFEGNSYDFVDWGGRSNTPPEPAVEYEAIPAIGGGTVVRPRIIHSQSQIQSSPGGLASALGGGIGSFAPSRNTAGISSAAAGNGNGSSGSHSPGILSRNSSHPYFAEIPNSAPPMMGRAGIDFNPRGFEGNPMKQREAYPYSPDEEEAIYTRVQGGRTTFIHPYDLERQRNGFHEEEYVDEDDDDNRIRQRRLRVLQQRQPQEYFNVTPSSQGSSSSIASSPPRLGRPQQRRRLSVSSNTTARTSLSTSAFTGHYPNHSSDPSGSTHGGNPKIVLRPSLLNNSIHHLSTLSQSNQTLSPYTRSLEHFAVRSGPPRALSTIVRSSSASATAAPSVVGSVGGSGGLCGGNMGSIGRLKGGTTAGIVGLGASTRLGKSKAEVVVKARRKRMYRIGGAKKDGAANGVPTQSREGLPVEGASRVRNNVPGESSWPVQEGLVYGEGVDGRKGKERQRTRRRRRSSLPGTDFDEDDMDRYFKSLQGGAEEGDVRPKGKEERR